MNLQKIRFNKWNSNKNHKNNKLLFTKIYPALLGSKLIKTGRVKSLRLILKKF